MTSLSAPRALIDYVVSGRISWYVFASFHLPPSHHPNNSMQGLFTNMVVVRTPNMEALPTLSAVLAHINTTTLQALGHQEMPFHIVVEEVNPIRDPRIHPLFQVSFILHTEHSTNLHGSALSTIESPELSVAPRSAWETETHTTRFDLNLQLWPHSENGEMAGYVEYSTELFLEDTVRRMVDTFSSLCVSIGSSDPTQRISTRLLLSSTSLISFFYFTQKYLCYPSSRRRRR